MINNTNDLSLKKTVKKKLYDSTHDTLSNKYLSENYKVTKLDEVICLFSREIVFLFSQEIRRGSAPEEKVVSKSIHNHFKWKRVNVGFFLTPL